MSKLTFKLLLLFCFPLCVFAQPNDGSIDYPFELIVGKAQTIKFEPDVDSLYLSFYFSGYIERKIKFTAKFAEPSEVLVQILKRQMSDEYYEISSKSVNTSLYSDDLVLTPEGYDILITRKIDGAKTIAS